MSDLQIPDAADELWFECGCQDKTCDREGYQKDALPFIVAAELRRRGVKYRELSGVSHGGAADAYAEVAHDLDRDADELDGGEPS